MLLSSIYALLSTTAILTHALVKVEKLVQTKNNPFFEDVKEQKHLQTPAIWFRKRSGYTEVCFKTQTKWLYMSILYDSRPYTKLLEFAKRIPIFLMLKNADHLKDASKNGTLSLLSLTNFDDNGITKRVLNFQVYLPELLDGHVMRLPCRNKPQDDPNTPYCNAIKPTAISMKKKCFFAIPMHHLYYPQGIQTYKKLASKMVKKPYDEKIKIPHPISHFYPPLPDVALTNRSAPFTRFFESTDYLYTDE